MRPGCLSSTLQARGKRDASKMKARWHGSNADAKAWCAQVLMERLRSRRHLSKDMRNRLRKALQALPPPSPGVARSLRLEPTPDGADLLALGVLLFDAGVPQCTCWCSSVYALEAR